MIEDVFGRHVEGMDPFHIESLWRKVYGSGYTLRPDVSLMGVLSGIEIALWDINGKALGKPVYELLGGRVHERLRSYTYIYPDIAKGQDDVDLLECRSLGRARRALCEAGLHRASSSIPPHPIRSSIRASPRSNRSNSAANSAG